MPILSATWAVQASMDHSSVEQGLGPAYEQTATELNLKDTRPYDYLAVIPTEYPG